ncbi:polysaccharide pyruvyl transferase CsaB [Jeotgalibacillus proteolyticus]|uniref:Polysaccharide pyruvyl transferase CsaB n=1 Tax=Jeotgalibacillus proteolyticus TaxID=2082395 RepID=A0A2S5GBI2_9BACL|nr:polysaccharide pyruvyl transferase CsaB [Jeotgalibacillus proteolyticus]PPA70275.1 polysaccharide pyruvyl transferase CsaB [Jeotgalibacillus proteolyticus]
MRLVLSGYYGFDNVGDEAILYAIIQSLRSIEPKVDIVVLSNNPEKTKEQYDVKAVNRWSIREVSSAIKHSDGLISGGGSLLQDETGWKSIPYYTGIMKIAQFLKKPVFVYAQGMGPFKNRVNKLIVKSTLNRASILTVRDEQSRQLLQSIGVNRAIQIVPDPVISLNPFEFSSPWMDQHKAPSKSVTVSIRDWPSDSNYMEEVALSLDELAARGYQIIFIPMHGKHDLEASKTVQGMMKQKSLIAPHDSTIQEKMAVIRESDILLGMRLHALIFASVGYTPFVALSYDPKVDSFASIVQQKVAGNVNINNWSHHDIVSSIEMINDHYGEEVDKLKALVSPLQQSSLHTAKDVIVKLT